MREARFSATGILLTFATVWVPRPGIEAPYTVGQVRLTDGPLLFAHIRGLSSDAAPPLPVHLSIGLDGAMPPLWFEPDDEER